MEEELGQAEKTLQALKDAAGCMSFVGSTAVRMADGSTKPISEIKVGDEIANALPGAPAGPHGQAHKVTAIHITYTDRHYTDVTIAALLRPGAALLGVDSIDSEMIRQGHRDDTYVPVDPDTLEDRLRAAGFVDITVNRPNQHQFRFTARKSTPPSVLR
ncbi:hypothetical protein ACQPZ8_18410 [Actinomadura nitritigenes]|uniref:hypothetical protein n=1 Tax=Actinomadura nitritigenes TaxID=134602 RepID=UPI003D8F0FA9